MKLDIDKLDTDGAIRETAEAAGLDRGDFLKTGALAGGGVLAGGVFFNSFLSDAEAAISTRRRSSANDVKILNFALTLEFLEDEFYRQSQRNLNPGAYGNNPRLQTFALVTGRHEAVHVRFLRNALGRSAIRKPRFDFGAAVTDVAMFAATAQVLEDTGVRAYLGQVGNVAQKAVLKAAGTIATVEARHAAWIRDINGGGVGDPKALPAPASFDEPASERTILRAAGGFIED